MSVETQHSDDDSSTDYDVRVDRGTTYYTTDKHRVHVHEDHQPDYLYLNDYVTNAVKQSVRFTDVEFVEGNEYQYPRFMFKRNGKIATEIKQHNVNDSFESLLFEVLINE